LINEYGSNILSFSLLEPSMRDVSEISATEGCLQLAPVSEGIQLSGETVSQVSDPSSSWLLGSPRSKEVGRVEAMSPVTHGPAGSVLAKAPGPLLETASITGVVEVVPELQREATKAVSLSQGKRTKVVVVGCSKKKAKAGPVRKSGRMKGTLASLPVMEKAQRLVAEKNLETGTVFDILDSHSDEHLSSILVDSSVMFVPSAGTPGEALSLLRAKEKVQAVLARVVAEKAEVEARAAREVAAASLSQDDAMVVAALEGGPTPGGPSEPSDASPGLGRDPGPSRGKPRRARAKRPLLTVRKGRGKKEVSKCEV
jgi:hypothetical protein